MRKRDYIREEKINKELSEKGNLKAEAIINQIIEDGGNLTPKLKKLIKNAYIDDYVEKCGRVLSDLSTTMEKVDTIIHKQQTGYPISEYDYDDLCEEIGYTAKMICRSFGIENVDDI